MIFENPLWLLGLLALPLIAAIEAWLTRIDRDRAARLVARPLWSRVLRRPAEHWRYLRLGLVMLGAAGLTLALARPQWGIVREKVEREGVDVVLLLDTSGSMATEDVPPNRFFLARQALAALISRLEGDRFALVAFEGEAYPLVPLTLDADALGLFLDTMEPGIVPSPGTSLGSGLAKGLDLFVDKERRNKVMVLVSDGEDLEGDVEEAVRRAKEAGVIVHTVGVGTESGQPVPDFDPDGRLIGFKHDPSGTAVVSRLNMQTLETIARAVPLATRGGEARGAEEHLVEEARAVPTLGARCGRGRRRRGGGRLALGGARSREQQEEHRAGGRRAHGGAPRQTGGGRRGRDPRRRRRLRPLGSPRKGWKRQEQRQRDGRHSHSQRNLEALLPPVRVLARQGLLLHSLDRGG